MKRAQHRTVTAAALAALLLGVPGTRGESVSGELVKLTDVVAYLRARVRAENPEALGSPEVMTARFRRELGRFDLDTPPEVELDLRLDDLKLAGLLLEEQLRRRRTHERLAKLEETDALLSREVEAFMVEAQEHAPELATEIAAIFQTIRQDRAAPAASRRPVEVEPERNVVRQIQRVRAERSLLPSVREVAARPDAKASAGEAPDTAAADEVAGELDTIQAELRAALASDPGAPSSSDDPLYGDRRFKVTSPDVPEVEVKAAAPAPRSPRAILRDLRARRELQVAAKPSRKVLPPPKPKVLPPPEPKVLPPPKREVLPPPKLALVAPMPGPKAKPGRDDGGLESVLRRVVPMVRKQASEDALFSVALRTTLGTLGIQAPQDFRASPGESPTALADRLEEAARRSGEPLDVEFALSALAL